MLRSSAARVLRPLATAPATTRSMGMFDKLKEYFVHYPELDKSQAQRSASEFRAKAPLSQGEAVIPQGMEPNREFSVKYYTRNTKTAGAWSYKDAEGKPAEVTPMKYMDGTPFLKKPEGVRLAPELLGETDLKPEDWYFGPRDAEGKIPEEYRSRFLGMPGPAHCPENAPMVYKTRAGLPIQPGEICSFETVKDFQESKLFD
mmetsp:Transcript_24767/g.60790  ORF Transcript_24767/g.60790 Transcript_24767/m.60790 type:complete len:202 (+) Transcript_24767:46-651(+)